MVTQAHVYVKGDVIGVGFRAWASVQARMYSITGWIRNNFEDHEVFGPEGGVEGLFQGTRQNLTQFVEVLHQGPSIARIDDVEVYWQEPTEICSDFTIRK